MNINLAATSKTKKKKTLTLGLNRRSGGGAASFNVFGDVTDDDNVVADNIGTTTASDKRAAVNQALKNEQEALRKRAQEAMRAASQDEKAMFDYDSAYDSFQQQQQDKKIASSDNVNGSQGKPNESRYIGDLLKAAEERKLGREMVYERKIAREQAEEEALEDYSGKERFVTAGYKRKLQERDLWRAEETRQRQEEEANDVTKKQGGVAMASFYGNLNRNVAFGGTGPSNTKSQVEANMKHSEKDRKREDVLSGGLSNKESKTEKSVEGGSLVIQNKSTNKNQGDDEEKPLPEQIRTRREQKVQQARLRYFERHRI